MPHNLQPSTSCECKYPWQTALTHPKIVWVENETPFSSTAPLRYNHGLRHSVLSYRYLLMRTKSRVADSRRFCLCCQLEKPGGAPVRMNWERQKRGKHPQGFSWDEEVFAGLKLTTSLWNKSSLLYKLSNETYWYSKK